MSHTRLNESDPPPNMRRNLRQLGSDVVTLVELQAELLKVDLKEWLRGIVAPLILAATGLICGLAALPVLLFSLAHALQENTELGLPASLLIASGAGLAAATVCALLALRLLRRDVRVLNRSASELRRNVRWLKEVMAGPSTAAS